MPSPYKLIIEMILVGLIVVVVSLSVEFIETIIQNYMTGKGNQAIFDRPYIMSMIRGVFITGALTHLLLEITKVNKYYAKNYK